ncbi:hypothetical protein SUGI_0750700 [Cryptomeria japonica]|uniref:late embryogenesis abundant protein Lea14-A n=1 Tax=Cryptomeria japonica TaxID=3369 RepID=UPI002414C866|nr:late embryogenesis abundant protein Lea14-A [Cryptomeria japonica]GLJ37049.1 hypothetical protein SUGI_0750700 [Cryptomeria japonica]
MAHLMDKAKLFVAEKIVGMEKPTADVTDVSVKDVSRDGITLDADVDVMNPYSHDLPIGEISYKMRSGERIIASGTIADPGSIMSKEKTLFNIPFKVPYDFMLSILKDVGKDWDLDYQWEVCLTMHIPVVGKFTLPLSKNGTLKMPSISDIF